MTRNFVPGTAVLLAAMVVLSACSSSSEEAAHSCPRGVVVGDASTMTRFKPGPGRDPRDVQFQAQLGRIDVTCSFDRTGANVETKVQLAVQEGPAAQNREASFNYFVAILDPANNVLARQEFTADYKFEGNRSRQVSVEELAQHIPGIQGRQGAGYQIAVGLAVTPEELNYNRQGMR